MASDAIGVQDRLDCRKVIRLGAGAYPLDNTPLIRASDPIGHRALQGCFEQRGPAVVLLRNALDNSLALGCMRLDVDQEEISQCGEITDAEHQQKAGE